MNFGHVSGGAIITSLPLRSQRGIRQCVELICCVKIRNSLSHRLDTRVIEWEKSATVSTKIKHCPPCTLVHALCPMWTDHWFPILLVFGKRQGVMNMRLWDLVVEPSIMLVNTFSMHRMQSDMEVTNKSIPPISDVQSPLDTVNLILFKLVWLRWRT